jgi:cation diffusion facilitator CzcD-associated flavoprotein CzcO
VNTLTDAQRQELRQRYRLERDKRLRPDGKDQYIEPTGRFAHLVDDPYTEVSERPAVHDDVTVAVIGAGFAGLVTAARLVQRGVTDVRVVDKAGDVGGVWYWNRYPGAMCDTAAMIYLPLLEDTGTVPSAKYVGAPEILAHARKIATVFALYDNALLSTGVTGLAWDEACARWRITTDRGDAFTARYVAMGLGQLHRPKLPGIEGIESFGGHAFHTSRWDYDYTGGDPGGAPLDGLADKRVGIIGTGATAVQCVPHLARSARELFVFQRTPSSVDIRNNQPIDPDWFAALEPGWQQRWLRNFTVLQTGGFADEDLVQDGWTDIAQRIRDRVVAAVESGQPLDPDTVAAAYADSDDDKMHDIRCRIDAEVTDPVTAEALKPWYRQLCKRPCFHDEYLQAFNLPGTRLVDTDGKGVTRIDASGVWVGDRHYDLDCLVFASGFEVGTGHARRAGFDVAGRSGLSLESYWSDGMRSLHGMLVHGFPNLFVLGITQAANLISNIPHNLVEAGMTAACMIGHAEDSGLCHVEVTAEAERDWVGMLAEGSLGVFASSDCTPGYYNNEGQPLGQRERLNVSGYPEGPVAYFDYIERWRSTGEFTGVSFTKAPR